MNIRYFIFFLLLAVFITTLSSIPSLGSGLLHNNFLNQVIRKSIHITLFAILAILFWQSCPGLDKDISVKIMVCIMALSLFAAFDEIHQMYVPGRNGNWVGFSFDVMGIVVGLSLMVFKSWNRGKHRGRRSEV